MYLESFKDLIVWQKSVSLAKEIYIVTTKFPTSETYGIASQIRRSSVSIASNIAEGHRRRTKKDFLHFLCMADGSAAELETQLIIVKDIYNKIDLSRSFFLLEEIQKMLNV